MSNRVFAIIVALWAVPAVAQQPTAGTAAQTQAAAVPITLREAEQRAVDRNPAIAGARLGTEAAAFGVAESRAAYSPSFSATVAQRSQTNPGTTQLSGGQQITNDALTLGTGLTQPLRWGGGSLFLDFGGSRNGTSNAFATYNPSFSSGITFSFVQPLFRGFEFDATRAEIEQAEIGSDIADAGLRAEMATTLANVRRAYWELVYAADALATSVSPKRSRSSNCWTTGAARSSAPLPPWTSSRPRRKPPPGTRQWSKPKARGERPKWRSSS